MKTFTTWPCLFRRFGRNERGQVLMTFGLSSLLLIVAIGSSIDFGRQVSARSNLQQATDATALAVAHTYLNSSSTNASLFQPAQTYLTGAMNSAAPSGGTASASGVTGTPGAATLQTITTSSNNTQVCLDTTMLITTTVMKIMGSNYLAVRANACAQTGQTYEVALVLDNSGSMAASAGGKSKMDALIDAAGKLVDILIPPGTTQPTTAISITPFTALVNVGSNTNANFLDKTGSSSIHWQNFHRPSGAPWRPASKLDLFSALQSQTWAGCVEDRPYPYITTDTAATTGTPDTLFVPFLSPDDPGGVTPSNPGYSCYPSGSSNCGRYLPPYIFFNSYLADNGSSTSTGNCSASNTYANMDNASGTQSDGVANLYPGAGMTMVCKYKGSSVSSYTQGTGVTTGPNYLCSSQQITPLTTSSTTLKSAISSMVAGGSTNLSTGFMWGWRTISPVVNPFPTTSTALIGPQNPKNYTNNTPINNKVIILMTDGFNSWGSRPYNAWMSTYESFGYYANNRLTNYSSGCGDTQTTASSYRCQMDNVTLEACNRAKAAGITVYTIGFTVSSDPIDTQGINLLKACATDSGKYFQASDSSTIVTAFQDIAAAIQNLRLAQ